MKNKPSLLSLLGMLTIAPSICTAQSFDISVYLPDDAGDPTTVCVNDKSTGGDGG